MSKMKLKKVKKKKDVNPDQLFKFMTQVIKPEALYMKNKIKH